MMSRPAPEPAGDLPDFTKFLDDYYVECEEHLAVARRNVLAIEQFVDRPKVDRGLLDELFRSFHSLKGLSAMVSVHEVEQVAHQLESYLGVLRKGEVRLSSAGLDSIVAGVFAIEQVLTAKRGNQPLPDVTALLDRLRLVLPSAAPSLPAAPALPAAAPPPAAAPTTQEPQLAAKLVSGGRAWSVRFVPSAASAQRGIDVNTVRRQLQELGELVRAEPRIEPGGQIAFHFVLVTAGGETLSLPAESGLSAEPYAGEDIDSAAPRDLEPDQLSEPATIAPSIELPPAHENPATQLVPTNLVRVDLGHLDELMRMVGELVLSRARLESVLHRLNGSVPAVERRLLGEINQAIEHQLRDLREGVMRVRMVPIREVFARMQFVMRDLVREQRKRAVLHLTGEETQIDKFIVERMMDPLLHLVRNAVSHGLEQPDERIAAGKPPEATTSCSRCRRPCRIPI
ncbi:MAG TPA: Hpt domain-containing protein [Pirellulales bacterium]|jgi:two-component system chemotaxis sensor kinase CheA|nr:Hpt domain-containing protein [Pirellulales bacterium]